MPVQIFISYRRDGGDALARSIYERLDKDGYECFFDNETLGAGRFDTALYEKIDECIDFLLVLPPGGLDRCSNPDDWVRLEIKRAIEKKKNIIPIMVSGFEFLKTDNLPESIRELPEYQSLRLDMNLFGEFIQKLESPKYLKSKPTKNLPDDKAAGLQTNHKNISTFLKVIPVIVLCAIASFFLPNTQSSLTISGNITIGPNDETTADGSTFQFKNLLSDSSPIKLATIDENELATIDTDELRFENYLNEANQGDSEAMLKVAGCYYKGKGTEQNLNQAFEWLIKSAEAGNIDSMWVLALSYSSGLGVEKNKDAAQKWFNEIYELTMKNADLNDSADMLDIGFFYLLKYGSDIDEQDSGENAFKWLKKSGESGNEDGKLWTGLCYFAGIGTDKNYEKAFELFNEVARDYSESEYKDLVLCLIGYCYAESKGIPQDYERAFKYFLESANAGNPEAMANVGAYYWQGKGVEQDYDQAFSWCLKGAESGSATAMNTLGKIYYIGKGTQKNYEKAFEWFRKAADADNIDALKNLSIMYKNGEGVAKDENKAKYYAQKYEELSD